MGRKLVLPYAIIAIIGIVTVIIISYVGVEQRNTIQNPDEGSGEVEELDAEAIFKKTCASCHGGDLAGDSAPGLTDVGSKYSEDEIKTIITEGTEGTEGVMPGGLATPEETAELAEWLSEME